MNISDLPGAGQSLLSGDPLITTLLIIVGGCAIAFLPVLVFVKKPAWLPALIMAITIFGGIWLAVAVGDKHADQMTQTLDTWVLETYGVDDSSVLDKAWEGEPITLVDGDHVYQLMTTASGQILLVDAGGREVPRL